MTLEDVATKEDVRKWKWSIIRCVAVSWTMVMLSIVAAILIFLPGCASLGLQSADTFNQKLAYAYGQVTAARKGAVSVITASCQTPGTQACQSAVEDGKHVQAMADEARQGLDLAKGYAAAGNVQQANVQLQLETAALTALSSYLSARGVK